MPLTKLPFMLLPYALSNDMADVVFAIASPPSSSAGSRGSCFVADVGVLGGELTARSDFAKLEEHSGQSWLPSLGDLKRQVVQGLGLAHALDHSMGSKGIFTGCDMSSGSWCKMGMLFAVWLFFILPVLRC